MKKPSMANNAWPPLYHVRKSARAKRIYLRICPRKGLELIVPAHVSETKALNFLDEKRDWVLRHQGLLARASREKQLPNQLNLHALEKCLIVRYEHISTYKRIHLVSLPHEIVLYGAVQTEEKCFAALKDYIYMLAEKYLTKWIQAISAEINLPFRKLSIRGQSTRWGSCNQDKHISLNYKLLFLPYTLIHYVLIHELCHTVHLNHSKNFWRLVGEYCPDFSHACRQLKQRSHIYIPDWL